MQCYVAVSAWLIVASILSACCGASNGTDASGGGLTVTVPGAQTGVTASAGNSLVSTSAAVTPISPSSGAKVDYSTPAPFVTAVQASYTPPALARVSTLSNRGRYLMSDSSTGARDANFLTIVEPYNATTGYSAAAEKITAANASYQNFLLNTQLQHSI